MSSATLLTKILLLLMSVRIVKDSPRQDQCSWVCDDKVDRVEDAVGTHDFKFNKRTHQNCTDDTVNSWDWITVGIIVAHDVDNTSEFSFSDFLTFGIEHVSLRQFLFGNKNTDLESVNSSVSCHLQPTSNETGRVASNGLDVLYSPLFYLRKSVTNSQKTPYVGYVEIGGTFYLSAGFTGSRTPEYLLKFDQWFLTSIRNLSILLLVVYTLFGPSFFTLFCANIKTVQIKRQPRSQGLNERLLRLCATKTTNEAEVNPCSKPAEQGELTEVVDPHRVNRSDHDISSSSENRDASRKFRERPVATEQGEFNGTLSYFSSVMINEDLELGSSTAAAEHGSYGHSEMVGLRRPAAKETSPPATVPEFSETQSGGTRGHGASRSSSTIEEVEPSKLQTGVTHQNIKNRNLDSVELEVMDVGAPASPVGLRSFIANKVFSNSENLSLFYQFVKFVILIMFPAFIPILVDVFAVAILRPLPRIGSHLPSPFLTKSVFIFTYKVCPGFYFFLIWYILRIFFFCSQQSSSHWVPSFLCRKHLVCFIRNHYLSQLIYPSNSWSACDECKEAPDFPKHCEIPVNIECNDGCSLLEIFKKDWKDVSENIYPEYIHGHFLGSEDESWCPRVTKLVCLILGGLLFILLVIMDIVASLPITSLCYGRVWFTRDWCQRRDTQAACLIGEFFVTCFSVVWIVYFLFCCFLSMLLALLSLLITAVNYPEEVIFYLAINIMVWHIIWSCYSSFTNVYDDLLLKLFLACSKDHESELNQYKEGHVQYIPQKLFTSACDTIKPVGNSVKKLFFHLSVWVVGLFFLLFIMVSSIDIPISKVFTFTVTFLVVVIPSLWDFLLTRSKKKERKDEVLKRNVKDHVDAFFKLD